MSCRRAPRRTAGRHGMGIASITGPRCRPGSPDGSTAEAPDVSGDRIVWAVAACGGSVLAPEPPAIALLPHLAAPDPPVRPSSQSLPPPPGGGGPIAGRL